MGWIRSFAETKLEPRRSWFSLSIHRKLQRSWSFSDNNNTKRNRDRVNYRYRLGLSAVAYAIFGLGFCRPSFGGDIGGVSATAAPNASSSGSVINQGVQVMQGPFHTNTYGGQIQCQGPTLTLSPFLTGAISAKTPYESSYLDPVYDNSDLNEDGILDNPGDVLYYKNIRTGQKDSNSLTGGVSLNFSMPLDGGLQRRCKQAVDTQIKIQQQILANKRLDFEISRLKHCGDLRLRGIMFAPNSPYADVCKDIIATPVLQHKHAISGSSVAPVSSQK